MQFNLSLLIAFFLICTILFVFLLYLLQGLQSTEIVFSGCSTFHILIIIQFFLSGKCNPFVISKFTGNRLIITKPMICKSLHHYINNTKKTITQPPIQITIVYLLCPCIFLCKSNLLFIHCKQNVNGVNLWGSWRQAIKDFRILLSFQAHGKINIIYYYYYYNCSFSPVHN